MTRKDYKLIAEALRDSKPESNDIMLAQWMRDVMVIVRVLREDNPRFNEVKFRVACDNWVEEKSV